VKRLQLGPLLTSFQMIEANQDVSNTMLWIQIFTALYIMDRPWALKPEGGGKVRPSAPQQSNCSAQGQRAHGARMHLGQMHLMTPAPNCRINHLRSFAWYSRRMCRDRILIYRAHGSYESIPRSVRGQGSSVVPVTGQRSMRGYALHIWRPGKLPGVLHQFGCQCLSWGCTGQGYSRVCFTSLAASACLGRALAMAFQAPYLLKHSLTTTCPHTSHGQAARARRHERHRKALAGPPGCLPGA